MPNLLNVNGKELKLAIKEANLTQESAAKRLGISRQSLNSWLKNDKLSEDVLHKVKRVLDIDLFSKKDVKQLYNQNDLSQKSNNKPLSKFADLSTQGVGFSDVAVFNSNEKWPENSTFPNKDKERQESPQWRLLYNLQQEKINLLNREIELLNQLIQQ